MRIELWRASAALWATAALLLIGADARAALRIVTTTTDLAAITREVAGGEAEVSSIAQGTQDPHYIEAKPSYMVKVSRADLVVSVGLELEVGWLPSILRGARNPKVMEGKPGFLEVGATVEPLEVPQGKVTRAEGDVHPLGNPHVWLDPVRAGTIAQIVAARLGELDPAHAEDFKKRAASYETHLRLKTAEWKARVLKTGVKSAITYHKTLTYFLDRFGVANPAILEPKPGIPPTTGHILEVIQVIKKHKTPLVLIENYFDPSVTRKIENEVPGIRSRTVPVAVGGEPGINSVDDLYEALVRALEVK